MVAGGGGLMAKRRILIIEGETQTAQCIERALIYEGYRVNLRHDGRDGLQAARTDRPDLVILDWTEGLDGLTVCRRLRAAGDVLILMLTAKSTVAERVAGLNAGADDYLVKPFALDELIARVRALLRRAGTYPRPEILRFADFALDAGMRRAYRNQRAIDLTAKEVQLLELFMRHPRQILTRAFIRERVWGADLTGESNIIAVYVRYLRQKMTGDSESCLIHTVRGVGYVLRED